MCSFGCVGNIDSQWASWHAVRYTWDLILVIDWNMSSETDRAPSIT